MIAILPVMFVHLIGFLTCHVSTRRKTPNVQKHLKKISQLLFKAYVVIYFSAMMFMSVKGRKFSPKTSLGVGDFIYQPLWAGRGLWPVAFDLGMNLLPPPVVV